MTYTEEQIQQAGALEFESSDLDQTLTVSDWLKRLLTTLLYEEEGFSSKRPFGNGGWKREVQQAFARAKLIPCGAADRDGYFNDCGEPDLLLNAIVENWK